MQRDEARLALLGALRNGHANARSANYLGTHLACSTRTVGDLAAELIDLGYLVGSTCDAGHHGYFLMVNEEDLDIGTRHIVARARSSWVRVSRLRESAHARFGDQALRLFEMEDA